MDLVLVLVGVVGLIVLATTWLRLHPFLALLLAALQADVGDGIVAAAPILLITGGPPSRWSGC